MTAVAAGMASAGLPDRTLTTVALTVTHGLLPGMPGQSDTDLLTVTVWSLAGGQPAGATDHRLDRPG